MKRIISVLASIAILCSVAPFIAAEESAPISLTVNGNAVTCDVPPQIVEEHTLVPLRAAFEASGAVILFWDETTSTVLALNAEGEIVSLQIGLNKIFVGDEEFVMEVPAKIIGDRTMVPIRAIAESLNCDVSWQPETRTVAITK